jgi:hypothetical protein
LNAFLFLGEPLEQVACGLDHTLVLAWPSHHSNNSQNSAFPVLILTT